MNCRNFYCKKKPVPLIAKYIRNLPPPDVSEESDLSNDSSDDEFPHIVSETEEEIVLDDDDDDVEGFDFNVAGASGANKTSTDTVPGSFLCLFVVLFCVYD